MRPPMAVPTMVDKMWFVTACLVIWLIALSSADTFTDSQDVYALNQIYNSLNSPFLNGWNGAGGDPCTEKWEGVACAGSNVTLLNLTGLGLTGGLGPGLQNLTALIVLDLSNNLFSNAFPLQLPPHVQILDLSVNQFTGSLPSALAELNNLATLNVSSNLLSGNLLDMFAPLEGVSSLDLSSNNFNGALPPSFASLTNLNYLYVQDNTFSGSLNVLASLPLIDLDVSNNSFTGWIPLQLKQFPTSKFAGNSFNTFSAPPPPPPLPASPYSAPVKAHNTSERGHSNHQTKSLRSYLTAGRLVGIAVALLLMVVVAILIICFFTTKKQSKLPLASKKQSKLKNDEYRVERSWRGTIVSSLKGDKKQSYVLARYQKEELEEPEAMARSSSNTYKMPEFASLNPPPAPYEIIIGDKNKGVSPGTPTTKQRNSKVAVHAYTIADLQVATNSFAEDNLIGDGVLGKVFKGELPNQKSVAVRKLDHSINHMKDENYLELLSKISKIRHENIVGLVGYCMDHGQRLLVYNYVNNGNLHEHLHLDVMDLERLDWKSRVKIASGTARALEYLHETFNPPIFHGNVTSNNILLDVDLTPYLSDCCLANDSEHERVLAESCGYSAPELTSGIYTTESDVYSFGVVMLELLTGRKALDRSRPRVEHVLVRWAVPQLCDIDAISKMLDPAMDGTQSKKCMSRFADIISQCVQADAKFRPSMGEVVQLLAQLQSS